MKTTENPNSDPSSELIQIEEIERLQEQLLRIYNHQQMDGNNNITHNTPNQNSRIPSPNPNVIQPQPENQTIKVQENIQLQEQEKQQVHEVASQPEQQQMIEVDDSETESEGRRYRHTNRRRVKWSASEDNKLIRGMCKHGFSWKMISRDRKLNLRRTNVQIKDRYRILIQDTHWKEVIFQALAHFRKKKLQRNH